MAGELGNAVRKCGADRVCADHRLRSALIAMQRASGQTAYPVYPVQNYTFGKKERSKPEKEESLPQKLQRLKHK